MTGLEVAPRFLQGAPPLDFNCRVARGGPNPRWPSGTSTLFRRRNSKAKLIFPCNGGGFLRRGTEFSRRSELPLCRCQIPDGITEIESDSKNGIFLREPGNTNNLYRENDEDDDVTINGVVVPRQKKNRAQSVEEEAWKLLRDSVVYYCSNPVGTIAANDPSDANTLNYDQVFIRDFIPSGVAFLLKGEYDIVRNFILHTLQLQVMQSFNLDFTHFDLLVFIDFESFSSLFLVPLLAELGEDSGLSQSWSRTYARQFQSADCSS